MAIGNDKKQAATKPKKLRVKSSTGNQLKNSAPVARIVNREKGSTKDKLFKFFAASAIGGVLLALLGLPVALAMGSASKNAQGLFNSLPSELSSTPMGQQSKFLASDGSQFATFFSENRIPVDSDQIAPDMKNAIISIEDGRFYEHGGFDLTGITRAAFSNASGSGGQQGASTLTQQYVKNMLKESALTEGNDEAYQKAQEVSIARKIREIKLSVSVEQKMSKDQILTGYLNVAYYGAQAYGIEAAAKTYFNKTASDLSLPEAAYLAGAVQNPTKFDAFQNPEASKERRDQVLERMLYYGHITQDQYNKAVATPLTTHYVPARQGCQYATSANFFCSYVANTILNSTQYGQDVDTRRRLLDRGGLVVKTTLDPRLQTAADNASTQLTPQGDASGVVSGLVTVQPGTGKVLAMAQSRKYDSTPNPAPGTTAINYLVDQNEGGGTGFQMGSTYKVFTLVDWLKTGHHLGDLLSADRVDWPASTWNYSCPVTGDNGTDDWNPENAEGLYGGTMTVQDGTVFSVNTIFTQMAAQLDLCAIRDTAESMGIHRADGQPLNYSASSILGTNEVAPLTVAAAYATFAAQGTFCKPISMDSIVDAAGKSWPVPSADCKQVLDTDVANGVNVALKDDAKRGTANGINAGGAMVAGKTGTTDNSAQTWVAGYTKGLSTASWVGNPDSPNQSMSNTVIGGKSYGTVFAEDIASPNWSNYMSQVGKLYEGSNWPIPGSNILGDTSARSNSPVIAEYEQYSGPF
ncbi:MAG: transglycosylase domain-containing protein [Micrococcaceae bacterium]